MTDWEERIDQVVDVGPNGVRPRDPQVAPEEGEARDQVMLSHEEVEKIREEREVMETWRSYSRHVVAYMLEACAICGTLREKAQLARCRWCKDTYICKEGLCVQKHQANLHPGLAFWTW